MAHAESPASASGRPLPPPPAGPCLRLRQAPASASGSGTRASRAVQGDRPTKPLPDRHHEGIRLVLPARYAGSTSGANWSYHAAARPWDNGHMGYRAMQLACCCGQAPDRILEVGFTSDQHMVVHFWCSACSRVLFISQSLDACEHACPPPDTEADAHLKTEDARFLQSLGIAVAE